MAQDRQKMVNITATDIFLFIRTSRQEFFKNDERRVTIY